MMMDLWMRPLFAVEIERYKISIFQFPIKGEKERSGQSQKIQTHRECLF